MNRNKAGKTKGWLGNDPDKNQDIHENEADKGGVTEDNSILKTVLSYNINMCSKVDHKFKRNLNTNKILQWLAKLFYQSTEYLLITFIMLIWANTNND